MAAKAVPYTPRPYAAPAFEQDRGRLIDLVRARGLAQAEAIRRSGDLSGNLWASVGQNIAGTLGEMARGQQFQQQRAAQLAFEQQKAQEAAAIKRAEMEMRAAEHADLLAQREDAAKRQAAMDTRQQATDLAQNLQPGVIDPANAQAIKSYPGTAGRVQIQDGIPVLVRTPVQAQQATTAAVAAKAAEAAAARQVKTDERLTATLAEQQRHNIKMENRPVSGAASPDGVGNVALSPDAVEEAAHRVRLYGPSSIPTRFNEGDKKRILNRSAEINKSIGQTPAAAAMRAAVQKADQVALNQITKMAGSAEAFENKALQQADLVKELSGKVGRTGYPIINGAIVSGKAAVGDTPAHLLANALLTYTSEYAKIIEGSTGSAAGSSDAARRAAASLISTALSKGTLAATVDQMNREIGMTRTGYRTTIDDITSRMGGGVSATTPSPQVTGEVWESDGKGGFRPVKKP